MTQLQSRKRNMYQVLEDYLATVPGDTISQMPNFSVLSSNFTSKVSDIIRIAEDQTWDRDGYAEDKEDYKLDMAEKAANIALSVKAYANNNGNNALKTAMSLQASYIVHCSAAKSTDKCRFIHTKATELLGSLTEYGIKEADLNALKDSISRFDDSISSPRTQIVDRKEATSILAQLFAECEAILKDMDVLAKMMRYRNPLFYSKYFSSRKVIQPSYKTLSIVGYVTDSDGMPLNKVRVYLKGTLVSKLTTDHGGFEIKHLESKVYQLQLEKAGFISTLIDVPVTATDRTEITVVLEREVSSEIKTA